MAGISVASGAAAGGFALTASHFLQPPGMPAQSKVTQNACPNVRPSPWLGSLRSGIHPGASPTVCFAAPPLDVFDFVERSLRSHPRMNPSTQPADGALRSRAAAELTLILLSGEKRMRSAVDFCGSCGATIRLASDGGLTADQSPAERTQSNCRSEPARDGGLTADQSLTECTRSNCGSWLASDGGLTANQSPTERTRSNCGSWLASDGGLTASQSLTENTESNCGSEPAGEEALSASHPLPAAFR
ncbi:hypothetical protein SAMN04490189_4043 [Pseudomonas koreensis]|nr:hypothetical protein SAMN04490189_4043 [Pseudomonas koreensis]